MKPPPLRRVVTGHDPQGRAVVTHDTLIQPAPVASGVSALTLMWTTATLPVDNNDDTDGGKRSVGLTLRGGTVLRIVDLFPGQVSPMHRTDSLDYGIVMSGEVELELDDGAVTRLEAGSVVVQRGTIHAWRNPSVQTTARIAFVLVDARPATVNGVALPAILPGPARDKT